eukprot:scaffold421222_cov51-Attheya_sp.AAC.1
MAEDLNSCHRRGDACGCYTVNGMARLVIGVAIGMGVCPIAVVAGGRCLPDPAAGFLLSPAASGPQSLDGGGVARSPILTLYAGGSSIPGTDIFEIMVAVRFDTMLEDGCGFCMVTVVMERRSAHPGDVGVTGGGGTIERDRVDNCRVDRWILDSP